MRMKDERNVCVKYRTQSTKDGKLAPTNPLPRSKCPQILDTE
jgi:hypothetical protein